MKKWMSKGINEQEKYYYKGTLTKKIYEKEVLLFEKDFVWNISYCDILLNPQSLFYRCQ